LHRLFQPQDRRRACLWYLKAGLLDWPPPISVSTRRTAFLQDGDRRDACPTKATTGASTLDLIVRAQAQHALNSRNTNYCIVGARSESARLTERRHYRNLLVNRSGELTHCCFKHPKEPRHGTEASHPRIMGTTKNPALCRAGLTENYKTFTSDDGKSAVQLHPDLPTQTSWAREPG
jgi:hypothetical protein